MLNLQVTSEECEISEVEFSKAVALIGLTVISDEALQRFESDIKDMISKGEINGLSLEESDALSKAIRDRSHLVKKVVTRKDGRKTTKWVKPTEAGSAKEGKKPEEGGSGGKKSPSDHAKESSDEKLEEYVKTGKDEELVKIAKEELKRRITAEIADLRQNPADSNKKKETIAKELEAKLKGLGGSVDGKKEQGSEAKDKDSSKKDSGLNLSKKDKEIIESVGSMEDFNKMRKESLAAGDDLSPENYYDKKSGAKKDVGQESYSNPHSYKKGDEVYHEGRKGTIADTTGSSVKVTFEPDHNKNAKSEYIHHTKLEKRPEVKGDESEVKGDPDNDDHATALLFVGGMGLSDEELMADFELDKEHIEAAKDLMKQGWRPAEKSFDHRESDEADEYQYQLERRGNEVKQVNDGTDQISFIIKKPKKSKKGGESDKPTKPTITSETNFKSQFGKIIDYAKKTDTLHRLEGLFDDEGIFDIESSSDVKEADWDGFEVKDLQRIAEIAYYNVGLGKSYSPELSKALDVLGISKAVTSDTPLRKQSIEGGVKDQKYRTPDDIKKAVSSAKEEDKKGIVAAAKLLKCTNLIPSDWK